MLVCNEVMCVGRVDIDHPRPTSRPLSSVCVLVSKFTHAAPCIYSDTPSIARGRARSAAATVTAAAVACGPIRRSSAVAAGLLSSSSPERHGFRDHNAETDGEEHGELEGGVHQRRRV